MELNTQSNAPFIFKLSIINLTFNFRYRLLKPKLKKRKRGEFKDTHFISDVYIVSFTDYTSYIKRLEKWHAQSGSMMHSEKSSLNLEHGWVNLTEASIVIVDQIFLK